MQRYLMSVATSSLALAYAGCAASEDATDNAGDEVAATQRVAAIEPAPQKGPGEVVQGDAAAGRVADLLAEAKVI